MKERGITDGLTMNQLAERNALAAENARMTTFINAYLDIANQGGALDGFAVQELALKHGLLRKEEYCTERHRDMVYAADLKDGDDVYFRVENQATDDFLAEVRDKAHKEGAYFVANRMLAAWDAGFIDDTAKNAADIARMILTSTEFMADAPEGDFDRSFADGVLEDIAAQPRKGGAA